MTWSPYKKFGVLSDWYPEDIITYKPTGYVPVDVTSLLSLVTYAEYEGKEVAGEEAVELVRSLIRSGAITHEQIENLIYNAAHSVDEDSQNEVEQSLANIFPELR